MRALLIVMALSGWAAAHSGGSPALADAPLGPYRLTYFDDMHLGTAEALLLLSGEDAGDAALTLELTSPSGDVYRQAARRVRTTPTGAVFATSVPVTEMGTWRARVSVMGPSGAAATEVTVITRGRFAGFGQRAAPYLSIALSLLIAFALVWRFAPRTRRPETLI